MPASRLGLFIGHLALLAASVIPSAAIAQSAASSPASQRPSGISQMYWTDSAARPPPASPPAMASYAGAGPITPPAPLMPCVPETRSRNLFPQEQQSVIILPPDYAAEHGFVRAPQSATCETPRARGLFSSDQHLRPSLDDKESSRKDFTARLTLPLAYSSNPISGVSDASVSNKGDWHVAPEVALKWSHQYDFARLTAEIGANIDRYQTATDADADIFFTTLKAELGDSSWDAFRPYFRYRETMQFFPTFRSLDVAFHEFAVGFSSGIGIRNNQKIAYADSDAPGDVSFNLDMRVGKRLSDIADYDRTFFDTRLTGAYYFSDKWRIEASPKFTARWYDNYFGDRRTDYRPGADVALIWKPDWLRKFASHSELALNFNSERNYSNLPGSSYKLFEIGPSLEFRVKY